MLHVRLPSRTTGREGRKEGEVWLWTKRNAHQRLSRPEPGRRTFRCIWDGMEDLSGISLDEFASALGLPEERFKGVAERRSQPNSPTPDVGLDA